MHFAQPVWILIGLLICAGLFLLSRYLERQRQTTLSRFAAPHLLPQLTRNISRTRRTTKTLLALLAMLLCCIALARPQYGSTWVEVKHRGIDILFALDTSKSMLAEDIKPNRLERARFAIMDFVHQLGGDRVGLLPFAGTSFLSCPLTLDYGAFEETLAGVNTESIPQAGTNLAAVITEAGQILKASGNHKLLILLTDGENLQGDALTAAKEAAEQGMVIHTVAVGTREGELIPTGNGEFIKDSSGKFVTSRLDEKILSEVARVTGGMAVPLGEQGQGLEIIYRQKLSLIPKSELAEQRQKMPVEQYSWPLILALLLLSAEFLFTERRQNGRPIFNLLKTLLQKMGKGREIGTILLFFSLSAFAIQPAHASPVENSLGEGGQLKNFEKYLQALEKEPNNPQANYNYGTAVYKNKQFEEAISSFTKALKTDDLDLQAKAYYNKANAHYRKGEQSRQTDTRSTSEEWHNALEAYGAALKLQPDDADARFNHDLVTKKLEELKKQEQEEQQNQSQKQNPTDGKDDKKGQEPNEGKNAAQPDPPHNSQPEKSGDDKKPQETKNNRNHSPQPAASGQEHEEKTGTEQQRQLGESQPEAAQQDNMRRLQGKMTRDEAQKLLRSLKGEEKTLTFTPEATPEQDPQPERNW